MAYLSLTSTWEENIYQISTTDLVIGGSGGVSNYQAQELGNRTEKIKNILAQNGIFISGTNYKYIGQNIIIDAVFNTGVSDGNLVYWNSTLSNFDLAKADSSSTWSVVGIADVTGSRVFASGLIYISGTGAISGQTLYLSATTAGAITTTKTNVAIGKYMFSDVIIIEPTKLRNTELADITSNNIRLNNIEPDDVRLNDIMSGEKIISHRSQIKI